MTGAHQMGSVLGVGITNGSPEGPAPAIGGNAVSSWGAVAAGNEPSSSNASSLEGLLDLGDLLAACWRSFATSSSLVQQGRLNKAARIAPKHDEPYTCHHSKPPHLNTVYE